MRRWFCLCLALVATVASGQRLTTFAWNAGADWPSGTTVELCGNGPTCLTGLTATSATLSLPVNPGEVIQGQARAHAPDGRRSEWATIAQTWPAAPVSPWAWKAEIGANIVREGYQTFTTISQPNGSTSLTIPANTTFVVVAIQGFADANQISSVTIGGTSLTQHISGNRADYVYWAGSLANPGTGTQTLAWSYSGGSGNCSAVVAYLSGVGSVRDSDSVNETSGYSTLNRVLDSGSSDDVLIFASGGDATSVIPSGSDQTRIVRFSNSGWGAMDYGYKSPGESTTTVYAVSEWGGLIGITLAPSGSVSIAPHMLNPARNFAHLLVR